MLWKTHIRISNEVLRRLGINLSSEVYSKFKEGIIAPDQWKDYPHHHGKSEVIKNNLMSARLHYLKEDLAYAYYHLGVALHYIQDSYTSVVSYRGPNSPIWHQKYEQYIENSEFVYNLENTIQYFFRNDGAQLTWYSELARKLSGKVEGKASTLRAATLVGNYESQKTGKAKVDLNMALKASLVVTESILSSKTSNALQTQLNSTLAQYQTYLKNSEIESSNRLIRLIQERDQLDSRRVQSNGVVSKIKNWIIGTRISFRNWRANSSSTKYFSRSHLKRVADSYKKATKNVIKPYEGWYNFQVPQLNIDIVKRHLLSVQEVAGFLDVSENSVKELFSKEGVPNYSVGNMELVRRTELNKALNHFPLKGVREIQS